MIAAQQGLSERIASTIFHARGARNAVHGSACGAQRSAEARGVTFELAVALGIARIGVDIALCGESRSRTPPNIFDVVIAQSGSGGRLCAPVSLVSAADVGVGLAAALVAPLCVCGPCLARSEIII